MSNTKNNTIRLLVTIDTSSTNVSKSQDTKSKTIESQKNFMLPVV